MDRDVGHDVDREPAVVLVVVEAVHLNDFFLGCQGLLSSQAI